MKCKHAHIQLKSIDIHMKHLVILCFFYRIYTVIIKETNEMMIFYYLSIIFIVFFYFFPYRLKDFKKSDFAKLAREMKDLQLQEVKEQEKLSKQGVEIRELYSVSGKTIPFFKEVGIR